MSTDKQFIRLNDRIERAVADSGERDVIDGLVDDMIATDRLHATKLAQLRQAARLTQTELGVAMGLAQGKVSRIESSDDILLSTLTRYLSALGEHPRVVVTVDGQDIELELTALPSAVRD